MRFHDSALTNRVEPRRAATNQTLNGIQQISHIMSIYLTEETGTDRRVDETESYCYCCAITAQTIY